MDMLSSEVGVDWVANSLRIHDQFWLDGKTTSPAIGIQLSKIENSAAVIPRRSESFPEKMHSLRSYTRAFNGDYGAPFVYLRIMDIAEDTKYYAFLSAYSKANYVHYINVGEMMINHERVPSLIMNLGGDELVGKNLDMTYLHDPRISISYEKAVCHMIQTIDAFAKSDQKPAKIHAETFYIHPKGPGNELYVHHLKKIEEQFPTLAMFVETKIQETKNLLLDSVLFHQYSTSVRVRGGVQA